MAKGEKLFFCQGVIRIIGRCRVRIEAAKTHPRQSGKRSYGIGRIPAFPCSCTGKTKPVHAGIQLDMTAKRPAVCQLTACDSAADMGRIGADVLLTANGGKDAVRGEQGGILRRNGGKDKNVGIGERRAQRERFVRTGYREKICPRLCKRSSTA